MRTQYVLVDYENVQPKELSALKDGPFRVRLFLGPNQTKIPVSLAASLQALGPESGYVALETSGPNAVDFMLAYTLGNLAAQEPSSYFHIISRDSGFDPMIAQLKRQRIGVHRSETIAEMPCLQPAVPVSQDEQVDCLIAHFQRHPTNRPKTLKPLHSWIRTHFKLQLDDDAISALIESMRARGLLSVTAGKLHYTLPEMAIETA